MVNGIQVDYQLKKGFSSRFNQKMFGRISQRKMDEKTYAYYIPGVLDSVPHARIFDGRIFIASTGFVDFDPIMKYCEKFRISSTSKDENDMHIQTARQKWLIHAKEKGLNIGE